MTDAVAAVTSMLAPETLGGDTQLLPGDVAHFEAVLGAGVDDGPGVGAIDADAYIQSPGPGYELSPDGAESLVDRMLQNVVSMDADFRHLFSDRLMGGSFAEGLDLQSLSPQELDMASMLGRLRETQIVEMEVFAWSTEFNLISTGISEFAGGIDTLFKNGGA